MAKTYEPSDELARLCADAIAEQGLEPEMKLVLKVAVESGELVPKAHLKEIGFVDMDSDGIACVTALPDVQRDQDFLTSLLGQKLYIIAPAQPNDGGE